MLLGAATTLLVLGCSEYRASRLYDQAHRMIRDDRIEDAVETYETLLARYPETDVAAVARTEVKLYRSLAEAVRLYPSRRARDTLVATARAIEAFRARRRLYPESLDSLVSAHYLSELPRDPWDRALLYRPDADRRGYRLMSYGNDGQPGGEADSADWVIEDGRFVVAASEDPP